MAPSKEHRPGLATDATGGPVVDPTQNVLQLVYAAVQRQDDLREKDSKFMEAESRHLHDMANLRAKYDELLRVIDMERQQKVREVDVLGGRTEAERAQAAIKALAEVSSTTAETLRKTVETTAVTQANQLDTKFAESNKRMSALELAVSSTAGKGIGLNAMWGYVAGAIGLIISILSAFGIVLSMRGR